MSRAEHDIVVDAPLRAVYNQWTQFEEFPLFMDSVQEVRQLDDSHLMWRATIAGRQVEWEAEIKEQVPDKQIIWSAVDGRVNAGLVSFRPEGDHQTNVHLELSYDPDGLQEHIGDALGFVSSNVKGDLERFKEFIERRGTETGGWRGMIENEHVPGGHTQGNTTGEERRAS
ncbi:MAG: SRPBCC family protein [Chloroflexota bacterium]